VPIFCGKVDQRLQDFRGRCPRITGGDVNTGREIIELLRGLNQEAGVTVISATHDLTMIDVSDRVVYIRDGRIDRIDERASLEITVGGIREEQDADASSSG